MLDPEILARVGIRPPRDVACGKDPWHTGFEVFVYSDASFGLHASLFGELNPRAHADTDDHEIRCQCCTALELDIASINSRCGLFEMEYNAVFLVNSADEIAEFGTEHAFQRSALWRHDWTSISRARKEAATSSPIK